MTQDNSVEKARNRQTRVAELSEKIAVALAQNSCAADHSGVDLARVAIALAQELVARAPYPEEVE
jgi:hypothetical protein